MNCKSSGCLIDHPAESISRDGLCLVHEKERIEAEDRLILFQEEKRLELKEELARQKAEVEKRLRSPVTEGRVIELLRAMECRITHKMIGSGIIDVGEGEDVVVYYGNSPASHDVL